MGRLAQLVHVSFMTADCIGWLIFCLGLENQSLQIILMWIVSMQKHVSIQNKTLQFVRLDVHAVVDCNSTSHLSWLQGGLVS